MDLEQLLRAEHSKRQTSRIVEYIGSDKRRFAALIRLFFAGEYRITQRAAWPLSYCVRAHPELIGPYFKPLLDNLKRKDIHVAVIRNTVRLRMARNYPWLRCATPAIYRGIRTGIVRIASIFEDI